MEKLKIGIPKGSLQKATIELFGKAGFNISKTKRGYKPSIDDKQIECILIRAQEIPKYVEQGIIDLGLSGKDWIVETKADIQEIEELLYSKQDLKKVKLVIAVAENSGIKTIKDLKGKRIATELVNITKNYLKEKKINAEVEFSWGATEVKVPELVDAIVDLTETGSSLKENNLRIIETIMESTTKLIANKNSMANQWKKKKIKQIALLLKGALLAESKVGLKMNIERKNLNKLLELLPALKSPTISELSEKNWLAVETIINEKVVREIIVKLKKAGAQGIIEYSLNKIIE
jgi:ATP phosphoribosyltransferase